GPRRSWPACAYTTCGWHRRRSLRGEGSSPRRHSPWAAGESCLARRARLRDCTAAADREFRNWLSSQRVLPAVRPAICPAPGKLCRTPVPRLLRFHGVLLGLLLGDRGHDPNLELALDVVAEMDVDRVQAQLLE